jgi:hypothetical protein
MFPFFETSCTLQVPRGASYLEADVLELKPENEIFKREREFTP